MPIVILANKQDLPGSRDAEEIELALSAADLGRTRLWHIQVSLLDHLKTVALISVT